MEKERPDATDRPRPTHALSKSTYMRGRQCPKALYLYKHRRDLLPPANPLQDAIFDTGTRVGLLAQQLFPNGVDVRPASHEDFAPSLAATQETIRRGERVIYEAAFVHDEVLAALDILVRTDDGWNAYEVKSSARVKDYQVQDVALQAHVIEGSGLPLADVSIVHMNTAYVRDGALDVQRLFSITSIRDAVATERAGVPARIAALKAMLASGEEPVVGIGPQCDHPFSCDFKAHCWAHMPAERSVVQLTHARGKEWNLYARGILRLEDIPDDEPLSAAQRVQVDGWKHGTTVVDRGTIRAWLDELRYPLNFLDFETVGAAVPLYDATRPFQPIPFQYSLHVQHTRGSEPAHFAYLGEGPGDPREALIRQLVRELGEEGDILTYHASFERPRLHELARDFPHHATALRGIGKRIKDLETPFLKGWYYVPAMNGHSSIKQVMPALVPDLAYETLNVREGRAASLLYSQMATGQYAGDVAQLRADLLAYCEMDTRAMVGILGALDAA